MFEIAVVLTLILIRMILPIGLMLLLGKRLRRREIRYWFG